MMKKVLIGAGVIVGVVAVGAIGYGLYKYYSKPDYIDDIDEDEIFDDEFDDDLFDDEEEEEGTESVSEILNNFEKTMDVSEDNEEKQTYNDTDDTKNQQ